MRAPRAAKAKATAPRARASSGTPVQLNLDGICRADKRPKPPKRLEKHLQAQTRATLGNLGYTCFEAGLARKQVCCPDCGCRFFPTGWQGNTPGYPDLNVIRYSPAFPGVGIWIELKGEDTEIKPEQQALADNGRSVICRTIEDAVRAVLKAEEAMDAYRFTPARRRQFEDFLAMNAGHLW